MKLDYAAICSLIPHHGSMCLIDTVEHWDARQIVCTSDRHRLPDNPLRSGGRLSCINGIEFAAQAMAVHGGLTNGSGECGARIGLLLSVRRCVFHCDRLDDIEAPLAIEALKIAGSEDALSYRFAVRANDVLLLEGRANVMLPRGIIE
jgi:predicted hotdog family 3-hydroxylacyl-ACP dehydratase